RQFRLRPRRAAGRHERASRAGTDRPLVLRAQRAGADGSRRDGLPPARAALRFVPTCGALPFARPTLRAAAPPIALRGLVPPAARRDAPARRRGGSRARGARRRGGRVTVRRRPRRRGRRSRQPAGLAFSADFGIRTTRRPSVYAARAWDASLPSGSLSV